MLSCKNYGRHFFISITQRRTRYDNNKPYQQLFLRRRGNAIYLNKLGYRARSGKPWHHATIRGIICNLAGNSLLSGNIFCGHCGSRLNLTTNGKAYPCKDDPHRIVKRVRYICYGKTRKQTECDGQTGYTAHILDGIIDKLVRRIFERMKAIPKEEIVNARYREKMEQRKTLMRTVKAEYAKASDELNALKAEIISWADMYDAASIEAKKMIVNCLIKRVEVYRGYKLHMIKTQYKAAQFGVCPPRVRSIHRRPLPVKAKTSRAARERAARALTVKCQRCFCG